MSAVFYFELPYCIMPPNLTIHGHNHQHSMPSNHQMSPHHAQTTIPYQFQPTAH
ncbi:hypothetical protein PAXRUDRAFT_835910 [Paxillus rubicundulus Ve08.2h10]|uniref:Uncharacterized protein n=1 Tax=Paxillus rubicundulus Ve08.2h10 TaxID=930991 RepID=A0A0D0CUD7_9AGAM|nr:hypothetical protein PAXRUDRAFT_835910 [Paxillus rubicundulus Ve08.2h10]